MKTTLEGNAFTFGKNLDTDQIYPGQYLELAQVEDIKQHAMGETPGSRYEFDAYIRADAADILQPDICRVGGITEMIKIVHMGQVAGKPIAPHHMMESTIQVACGVMSSGPIEYMPWVSGAFSEPMRIENGQMFPPQKPGLGLEIPEDVIQKYRIE